MLDSESGASAIIFKTFDWLYDCFLGLDESSTPCCLVIDGRWLRFRDLTLSEMMSALRGRGAG